MQASLYWETCSKIAQRAVKLSSTSIFSLHLKAAAAAAGDDAWEECGVRSERGERDERGLSCGADKAHDEPCIAPADLALLSSISFLPVAA